MPEILLEINTAVWLNEQEWAGTGSTDLADIPESILDEWNAMGVDFVWFLGVWKIGNATREICLNDSGIREGLEKQVPDGYPDAMLGSPFSIVDYSLRPAYGNETTLARLRKRLNERGIRLMLDFVPNHLAIDHPWVLDYPERFVGGDEKLLEREPHNYFRVPGRENVILAHGRDPYFAGWTDTAQVNIMRCDTRQAMIDLLRKAADQCDALRCDMAMLVTNDVFRHTWGDLSVVEYPHGDPPEFWREAIGAVKERHPGFVFVGEVYWGLEAQLQQMGFDFTYDKVLYDRLVAADGAGVTELMERPSEYQARMVRFIENHDEPRAAKVFGPRARAAATIAAGLPGMMLYHEGQMDGRMSRVAVQYGRRMQEPANPDVAAFYRKLLDVCRDPVIRGGHFRPLRALPAWPDNPTYLHFVAYWLEGEGERRMIAGNLASHRAQTYVRIPVDDLQGEVIEFRDLLGDACYFRSRGSLERNGLYLDLFEGGSHIFQVRPAPPGQGPDPNTDI